MKTSSPTASASSSTVELERTGAWRWFGPDAVEHAVVAGGDRGDRCREPARVCGGRPREVAAEHGQLLPDVARHRRPARLRHRHATRHDCTRLRYACTHTAPVLFVNLSIFNAELSREICHSQLIFSVSLSIRRYIVERKHSWNRVIAYLICRSVCLFG